jgi:tape measure domain-containing protein
MASETLAELIVRLGVDGSGLKAGFEEATGTLRDFGSAMESAGARMTAMLTVPIVGFAAAALKASADIESLKLGLNTITGSAAETEIQFARLREIAKLPGIGFEEAIRGSVSLQAAGFSAQGAERAIRAFGNALAGVGRGKADLDGVIVQLQQMASKSNVVMQDLRPILERVPQVATVMRQLFGTIDTEVIQKMGIKPQQFIGALVTELEKLPPVTTGLKNAFENFSDNVKISLAKAGDALSPFAQGVINSFQPIFDTLTGIALAFVKLPEPVQTAVIAFGALLAIIGPMGLALGGVITTFSTLSTAVVVAGGFIANNLTVALAAARGAALLTAAAFAGWKLGEWAYANIPGVRLLADTMAELLLKIPGVQAVMDRLSGSSAMLASADKNLQFATDQLEQRLKAKGITVDKAGLSLDQYAAKLREAAAGQTSAGQKADMFKTILSQLAGSVGGANTKLKEHSEQIERLTPHYMEWQIKVFDARTALDAAQASLGVWNQKVLDGETGLDELTASMAALGLATITSGDAIEAWGSKATQAIANAKPVSDELRDALKDLGVPSHIDTQFNAAKAAADFKVVQDAWVAGTATAEEFDAALKKVNGSTGETSTKAKENVSVFGKQVSTIMTDMSREIANGVFGVFDTSKNKELNAQADEINQGIMAKQKDLEQFRKDNAADQVSDEQKVKDALAEKEDSYRDYVLKTDRSIAEAHAKGHFAQEQNLRESLAKRTEAMEKYRTKAEAQLADIARKHAEALAKQEADFAEYKAKQDAKLDEIHSKHVTVWGNIKNLIGDVFESAGKAVVRFVVEFLEQKLFKALAHLVGDLLPGVGSAIGGIFGGGAGKIGETVAGAGNAATGAINDVLGIGGSAASAGGSIAGAAGGAGSAAGGALGLSDGYRRRHRRGCRRSLQRHRQLPDGPHEHRARPYRRVYPARRYRHHAER